MRVSLFSAILLLPLGLSAFNLLIDGKATGLETQIVHLTCPAWPDAKMVKTDDSGAFSFSIQHRYPAMFTLVYGEGFQRLETDFFVFEDMRLQIELEADSVSNDRIALRITDRRALAFRKAKAYMDQLYVLKSTHSQVLEGIIPDLEAIYGIEPDNEYSAVFILAEKLCYIHVMAMDYGKSFPFHVFDMPLFEKLPVNEGRFMGFKSYTRLMTDWNAQKLAEKRNQTQLGSDFSIRLKQLDKEKNLNEIIRFSLYQDLFEHFDYARLSDSARLLYKNRLLEFTAQYPENPEMEPLLEDLYRILRSLVGREAPAFLLADQRGKYHRLSDWHGQILLIDLWGSWCRPCRENNQRLKVLYQQCQDQGLKIEFISVAKEDNLDAWQKAMEQDQMPWSQLLADDLFLSDYQIGQFPMAILVDQDGIVQLVSPDISLEDLQKYLVED